jgi:hypothetical protein
MKIPFKEIINLIQAQSWYAILLAIGIVSFLIYRLVDFLQIRYVKKFPMPGDLEKLTNEVYEKKRKRKKARSVKLFWKGASSWLVHTIFVLAAIPMLITISYHYKLSSGVIYILLMVAGFIINMLLSKLFPPWSPAKPYACRAFQNERTWQPANMAMQAWGIASWAVPVYYFWENRMYAYNQVCGRYYYKFKPNIF